MDDVLVSISCLTYNHEQFIEQCIDGFLTQRTNFAFEILIHDDASPDSTQNILKEYENKYPDKFRIIYRSENIHSQGYRSLNRFNYERARGKYIAICEGDDFWIDSNKLQKQVDFLEQNPDYSMCFHDAIKLDETNNIINRFCPYRRDCDLTIHDAIHNWYVPTASIVVRKEIILNYKSSIPQIYSEDYSIILKCIHAGRVRYINRLMSVYRLNSSETSMSSAMKNKNIFMLEQKILLLNSFKSITNNLYTTEINSRLKYLNQELKFQKAKKSKNLIHLLLSYKLIFTKLALKIIRIRQ